MNAGVESLTKFSTRSVDPNLARRFNAGLRNPRTTLRVTTTEYIGGNFNCRYATRLLNSTDPGVETPG
jgi:hypothetical protein